MLIKLGALLGGLLNAVLQPWLRAWSERRRGRRQEKADANERVLEDVADAQEVRRRIADDPDYAERLRERSYRD
jgi:hypothetical protein